MYPHISSRPHPQRPPAEATALKQALQRTHFHIGGDRPPPFRNHEDDDGDDEAYSYDADSDSEGDGEEDGEGMYVPSSRLPDPRKGPGEVYRVELNAEVRARIRASSVHWGEEALRWGGIVSFMCGGWIFSRDWT